LDAPAPAAGAQQLQSLSVNSPNGVNTSLAAGAGVNPNGYLPPDLIIEPEDVVTFQFITPPGSVDSPLVVSYEELTDA